MSHRGLGQDERCHHHGPLALRYGSIRSMEVVVIAGGEGVKGRKHSKDVPSSRDGRANTGKDDGQGSPVCWTPYHNFGLKAKTDRRNT